MTESWINAFLNAVAEAEQVERHHTELSEQQAADLLRWCWYCGDHRKVMTDLLGETVGQSPGRPANPDTSDERRALFSRHVRSQAPSAPRMPRPGQQHPGVDAPVMPRPGP